MRLRVNAPVDQAQAMAERYAELDGVLATSQAMRRSAVAVAHAAADAIDRPIVEEMDALRDQLDTWYRRNADLLTGGKRRSAELGGCMLGLRAGRAKLAFAGGDDKAAVAALQQHRWAKPLVRVTYAIDRSAALKALNGKQADQLAALGFTAEAEGDTFTLARVDQPATPEPTR